MAASVTLTAAIGSGRKIAYTATFSEDVTGFTLVDIDVTNGSASNLAGSGSAYTFDVTPITTSCIVSTYIPAGVVTVVSDNSTNTQSNTVKTSYRPLGDNRDLAIGYDYANFLDASGFAWAWGRNNALQIVLGDNTLISRSSPVSVVGGIRFKKIVSFTGFAGGGAYNNTTLGLDLLGRAWAWGENGVGNLGDGTITDRSSPVSVLGNYIFTDIGISSWEGEEQVAYGFDESGYMWTWGLNVQGNLGDNTKTATGGSSSPVSVVGGRKFIKIAASAGAFTGLDESGYLWAWGKGGFGVHGNNANSDRSSPVSVVGGRKFIDVVKGQTHVGQTQPFTLALDESSYAWAWGSNAAGSLGDGTTISRSSPVSVLMGKISKLGTLLNVSTGVAPTVVLDQSSYAWAWGANVVGAIGDNTTSNKSSPVSVAGDKQFIEIGVILDRASAALDANGYMWTWGNNNITGVGGLGDNTTSHRSSPVSVVGAKTFMRLPKTTKQQNLITVLGKDNGLWSFGGLNTFGAIGDGLRLSRSSPVSVVGAKFYQTPTASFSPPSGLSNGGTTTNSTLTFGVDWNLSVSDFILSDIQTTNCSAYSFAGTGTSYTFYVDKSANGAAEVFIPDGVASSNGYFNQDAAAFSWTFASATSDAISVSPSILSTGSFVTTEINVGGVAAISAISSDPDFSNPSSWNKVHVGYEGNNFNGFQRRILTMSSPFSAGGTKSVSFAPQNLDAAINYSFQYMVVEKSTSDYKWISRTSVPGYENATFEVRSAPSPASGITTSSITSSSIVLSWGGLGVGASYKVVKSSSLAGLDTIAEVDAITGADLIMDWAVDTYTTTASSLSSGTKYYFAVLAKTTASPQSYVLYKVISEVTA